MSDMSDEILRNIPLPGIRGISRPNFAVAVITPLWLGHR
jgi:hypothetical protein